MIRRFFSIVFGLLALSVVASAQVGPLPGIGPQFIQNCLVGGNTASTTVLLHLDGTNGATTFPNTAVGGSTTWAATNAATISTATSEFGTGSLSLPQSPGPDFIETAVSTDFAFGTGNFSIDFWIKRSETGTASHNIMGQGNSGLTGGFIYFQIQITSSNIKFSFSDTSIVTAGAITDTNWHHVMAVRNGNSMAVALDGTFGSTISVSGVTITGSGGFVIGRLGDFTSGPTFPGNIDEFRIVKGGTTPIANFTPNRGQYCP